MPGKHLKNDTENKKHHSQSHQDGQHGKVNLQVLNRVKMNYPSSELCDIGRYSVDLTSFQI
jgi:hypothetical protein